MNITRRLRAFSNKAKNSQWLGYLWFIRDSPLPHQVSRINKQKVPIPRNRVNPQLSVDKLI